MAVKIITDSGSDMSQERAARLGIRVIPPEILAFVLGEPIDLSALKVELEYASGGSLSARLKREGKLTDMTMSEFADWYRANRTYAQPEVSLWRDILYGSEKQHFWYCDPWMRCCLDMNQGGAMIDLRPYAARLYRPFVTRRIERRMKSDIPALP